MAETSSLRIMELQLAGSRCEQIMLLRLACFGLCPCQHNGTYTRNVYPATPTKKPAQILRFAESKNEPLSRKILGKAAQNALGKGTGPSNLPKPILASFCHASKNGRKKARKSLKLLGFSQRHLFWCSLMASSTLLDTILSFSVLSTAFRKQAFIEFAVPKQSTVQRTQVQNL